MQFEDPFEVRFHGRGGQGAVVASRILAEAAFIDGLQVQCFPEFGVERRGAPVTAYLRLSRSPILIRSGIYRPGAVVILSAGLATQTALEGATENAVIVCNMPDDAPAPFDPGTRTLARVDATAIARGAGLGTATTPIVNTAMVGAFARATGSVTLDAVRAAVRKLSPAKADANVRAAEEGYELCRLPTAAC